MKKDERLLVSPRFPRSSKYHPDWLIASASGGAHSLWLTEWLAAALDLRPGMRVLDLGCGMAASSIFLRREFGVQVWATDLWFSAAEQPAAHPRRSLRRRRLPYPRRRAVLPFAADFFDAIVSIDSYFYYGTDDLYLSYLARFVKPGGPIWHRRRGLMREINGPVPEHLRAGGPRDLWCLHSAPWWRRHWERPGFLDVELADTMPDGWQLWLDWHHVVAPNNALEIKALEADRGSSLGYVRLVGRRRGQVTLADPIVSLSSEYTKKPLLRAVGVE